MYLLQPFILHKWQCKVDFFVHCKYYEMLFSHYFIEMCTYYRPRKNEKKNYHFITTSKWRKSWLNCSQDLSQHFWTSIYSPPLQLQKSITKIPLSLRKLLIQNRYIEHGYRRAKSSEILLKVHQKQASQLLNKTKLATDARTLFDL